jgi:hypothetical protein
LGVLLIGRGGVKSCLEFTKGCLEGVGEGLGITNVRFDPEATLDSDKARNHILRRHQRFGDKCMNMLRSYHQWI